MEVTYNLKKERINSRIGDRTVGNIFAAQE